MKKVLIISYFFPPNNFTASNRAYSFAKHLKKFGYQPIVITRNWEVDIKNSSDLTKPAGREVIHNTNKEFETYILPYKGSFRDKFQSIFQSKFAIIRKLLSMFELIFENFGLAFLSHSNFYYKAKELIEKEKIEYLIISASPFNQFYYGWLLKKEFSTIKWLADYRDEWTSKTLVETKGFFKTFILNLQTKKEKLWLSTADIVVSVSEKTAISISKHISLNNYAVVENGFFKEDFLDKKKTKTKNEFLITYTGEIYEKQNFNMFLNAVKLLIVEYEKTITIKLQFIGLKNQNQQKAYIINQMIGFEQNISFTKRVSRKECIQLELNSDCLLMVAYGDLKGIPSSKLYQYIGSQKPIFLCPSDNDIIEEYLLKTNQGIISNTSEEAYIKLKEVINAKIKGKKTTVNCKEIQKFSRKEQTKKLAQILNSL